MSNKFYFQLLFLHILIGIILYYFPVLSKLYSFGTIVIGFIWVFRNKNLNDEALITAAYFVGSEILVRMTYGYVFYEHTKYSVILILLLGIYFKGFAKNAAPIWVFTLLLFPALFVGMISIGHDPRFRQLVLFNLSGPLCLIVSSLYCFNHKITLNRVYEILLSIGLPIISALIYIILFTPDLKDYFKHTGSQFATSGGFGPNQVATILGLGMFIFLSRVVLNSKSKLQLLFNLFLTFLLAYRCLITFSRGGLITGFIMIFILISILLINLNGKGRFKLYNFVFVLLAGLLSVWFYSIATTSGFIEKRYLNQDALGREKASVLSGREKISLSELSIFLENPFLGGGVGSGTILRKEIHGAAIASHNEITRMIGEHGSLGIIALLLLLFTPLILYIDNKNHIFLVCFLVFWFFTLNHAAMRTASPAFIYSLALLKIISNDKNSLYRK